MVSISDTFFIHENVSYNKFIVSDIDNSYASRGASVIPEFKDGHTNYEENLQYPLTFYRCRVDKQKKLSRTEMLNIPLNKRSLCASERFSIPGIPCLYLGVTSYCCWKEVGCPSEYLLSSFRLKKKRKNLRILNLVLSQALLNGRLSSPCQDWSDLEEEILAFFPIVLATAFHVENYNSENYHSEYTIANLIMNCLYDLKIDGIAYFSAKNASEFDYPYGVDLAIPILGTDNEQIIRQSFEVSDPCRIKMCELDNPHIKYDKESYINHIYKNDEDNGFVSLNGTRKLYKELYFSKLDNYVASTPFKNISIS